MTIPPIGIGRIPSFPTNEYSPQEDLKIQLEMVDLIQSQMGQNSGNPARLNPLMDEFQETVQRLDNLLQNLPHAQQKLFKAHIDELSARMQNYYLDLVHSNSQDALYLTRTAVSGALSTLMQDLGIQSSKQMLR
jgi:hypothetical protein